MPERVKQTTQRADEKVMRAERAGVRMSPTRWIIVVCGALACVGLILTGHGVAALGLLVAGIVVAIARRDEPVRRVRVERFVEIAELPHSCEVVWALIKPAELSPTFEPSIRRGYHVAGTPLGLGERQAFELLDGSTAIFEVVDYEPGRRAVTIQVSPDLGLKARNIFSVEPVEGGCALSLEWEIDVPAGQCVSPDPEDAWRTSIRAQFDRIRHVLAASDSGTSPEKP
jgi:hypothetical protein